MVVRVWGCHAVNSDEVNRRIKWCTGGEIGNFDALYERFAGLVRSVVFKLCRPDDSDDVVQEVFLKIWKGLLKFDRRSSLRTWVYRISYNVCVDQLRRNQNQGLVLTYQDELTGSPDTDMAKRDVVQKALGRLGSEHRAVLVLNVMEGLTIAEISAIMGIAQGTVKSRLHHARARIHEFLTAQGVSL